jgi:hypothetical protein
MAARSTPGPRACVSETSRRCSDQGVRIIFDFWQSRTKSSILAVFSEPQANWNDFIARQAAQIRSRVHQNAGSSPMKWFALRHRHTHSALLHHPTPTSLLAGEAVLWLLETTLFPACFINQCSIQNSNYANSTNLVA